MFGGCAVGLGRARLRRLDVVTSRVELGLELLGSLSMTGGFGRRAVDERLEIGCGGGRSVRGAPELASQTFGLLVRRSGVGACLIKRRPEFVRPLLVRSGVLRERFDLGRQPR